MHLEKELESWSILYSVNIWFLPVIFKEFSWKVASRRVTHNMLFIAQSSGGETENILKIFCHNVFSVRFITTHSVL